MDERVEQEIEKLKSQRKGNENSPMMKDSEDASPPKNDLILKFYEHHKSV